MMLRWGGTHLVTGTAGLTLSVAVQWVEAERRRDQSLRGGPSGGAGVTADHLAVTAASQPCVPPPSSTVMYSEDVIKWPPGLLPSVTFHCLPSPSGCRVSTTGTAQLPTFCRTGPRTHSHDTIPAGTAGLEAVSRIYSRLWCIVAARWSVRDERRSRQGETTRWPD